MFQDDEPIVGKEYFVVDVTFNNDHGRTRYDMHIAPQKTNMSHEEKVHGWLGETNNINQTAIGKWRLDEIMPGHGEHWTASYKVKMTRIE